MPKTLVGTASQNRAWPSPHKNRNPSAPVIPGRMEPILCAVPPIFKPMASVRQKPLMSMRMMMVEMAMPTTPMPKMVCETVLPVSPSSEAASWEASRLTSAAASFWSAGCAAKPVFSWNFFRLPS